MSSNIKFLLAGLLGGCLALSLCRSDPLGRPPGGDASPPPEWYEGGTLHKATTVDWRNAEARDRLATSADFAAVWMKKRGTILKSPEELEETKPWALALATCIDKVCSDETLPVQSVAEIAAGCMVIMEAQAERHPRDDL